MAETPLMVTLLAVARAIQNRARQYPKEAAPYFLAAYNTILDFTPESAVWLFQVFKWEERLCQHRSECTACKPEPNPLDCPTATMLLSKLDIYRTRLSKAEANEKWESTTSSKPGEDAM